MRVPAYLIRLSHDVSVSVLANLITAAVIYLVGSYVELLPRNAVVQDLSLLAVTIGAFALLAALDSYVDRRRRYEWTVPTFAIVLFGALAWQLVNLLIDLGLREF